MELNISIREDETVLSVLEKGLVVYSKSLFCGLKHFRRAAESGTVGDSIDFLSGEVQIALENPCRIPITRRTES
jgi:hypothetical protein